jgi:hypothetical protein
MNAPSWNDLKPGDTVIEHDGHKAIFVIAKDSNIIYGPYWDVIVLSSSYPNNDQLMVYRENWIRRSGPPANKMHVLIPPNHEVVRNGKTIIRT